MNPLIRSLLLWKRIMQIKLAESGCSPQHKLSGIKDEQDSFSLLSFLSSGWVGVVSCRMMLAKLSESGCSGLKDEQDSFSLLSFLSFGGVGVVLANDFPVSTLSQ